MSREDFEGGTEGLFRRREGQETVMHEFVESARRETGDTHLVSFLSAALIAAAGLLLVATSLAMI